MPDFSDQLNMSSPDPYRLSPIKGVPKSKSAAPPIGGTTVSPSGAGTYDMSTAHANATRPYASYPGEAAAHTSFAGEQRLPGSIGRQPPLSTPGKFPARSPSLPVPSAPVHASGDDLVDAYAKMSSGFPKAAPVAPFQSSPEALASVGSADTFAPAIRAAAIAHAAAGGGHTGEYAESALSRMVGNVGRSLMAGPDISAKQLGRAGMMGLGAQVVNHPHQAIDQALHPVDTWNQMSGMPRQAYNAITNPQGTWVPDFTQGLTALMTGDAGVPQLWNAAKESTVPGAVGQAGVNAGQALKKHLVDFGTGSAYDTAANAANVVRNKVADRFQDPGRWFDK